MKPMTKSEAIEMVKKLRKEVLCCTECGKVAEYDCDGDLCCPDGHFAKLLGSWEDLGLYNFLMERFEIREEDLKR